MHGSSKFLSAGDASQTGLRVLGSRVQGIVSRSEILLLNWVDSDYAKLIYLRRPRGLFTLVEILFYAE